MEKSMNEGNDISEIKDTLANLNLSIEMIKKDMQTFGNLVPKLTDSLTNVAIYMRQTSDNTRRLDEIGKKVDTLSDSGTKQCDLNHSRLDSLADDVKRLEDYMSRVNAIALTQFVMFILTIIAFLIQKYI